MHSLTKPLLFASPDECEQAFYDALEAGDVDALNELWLDDDDVCCVHPGGPRLTGSAAVRASWAAILADGPVRMRAVQKKSLETPTIALSNVIEELIVTQGRSQRVVHVITTNGFVKTPGGWKMMLHHASQAPEGRPPVAETPSGTLH
ncbi:MAG TPA: nuclear transport factor 2 family protein [Burkholderiaceae bacterium]|nr:nuclear transport factor 2 family protein [Burkholderiaceae bacterium]